MYSVRLYLYYGTWIKFFPYDITLLKLSCHVGLQPFEFIHLCYVFKLIFKYSIHEPNIQCLLYGKHLIFLTWMTTLKNMYTLKTSTNFLQIKQFIHYIDMDKTPNCNQERGITRLADLKVNSCTGTNIFTLSFLYSASQYQSHDF